MTAPNPSTSESTDTAAGSGIAGTGSQTRSSSTGSTSDVVGDINQGEAYATNMKMLVAAEFGHFQRLATYAEQALKDSLSISNQIAQNAVSNANQIGQSHANNQVNANNSLDSERQRTIRHGDVATDRTWNIDEQTHAVSQMIRRGEVTLSTAELAQAIAVGLVAALRDTGASVNVNK